MKAVLILIGVILLIVAVGCLVTGLVEVAQGKKGTWGIWYFYVFHGVAALAALTCFYFAAEKNRPRATESQEEGGK